LAWWSTTGGPDLLEEFKKRTLPDPERTRIQALVQKLGENAAATREKALADLLALGTPAIPFLRQAVNDRDARAADQAQKCLQLLDQNTIPALPMVAVRLLALRRPVGAAEAVLGFLPSAEDETIAQELRGALAALVIRDGKVDPAYLKALEDKEPIRRAGAAEALCQAAPEFRPTLRKLLQDPDPVVRWRVALALGTTGEKEALPVLIALLTELPSALADQAESSLRLVAGENSPDVTLGEDEAGRKKARAAWEAWWKKNGDKADLARLDSRSQFLGFTLVVEQYDPARRTGRVLELDRRGKTRWQIEGLMAPSDAQVLPGDRVLVCEQNSSRVSERDLKGKVVWERQLNQPVVAQRLANGNTFLVGRGQISEVDRNGKEIYNHPRPAFDIICGKKLRNGHITYVTNQGLCVRMDASGKELKTIRVPPIQVYNGYVDMLANDHVLVPLYGNNRVAEFDAEGKIVWEATITLPMSARRLANGNTLVTSVNPSRVVELDRNGKAIWENKEPIRQPTRADRR
jgi:hypothetical protein